MFIEYIEWFGMDFGRLVYIVALFNLYSCVDNKIIHLKIIHFQFQVSNKISEPFQSSYYPVNNNSSQPHFSIELK